VDFIDIFNFAGFVVFLEVLVEFFVFLDVLGPGFFAVMFLKD
jgi:hypothetical protein